VVHWRGRGPVRRIYLAIAAGRIAAEGHWAVPLGKQRDRGGRVRAVREGKDLLEARTHFERLAISAEASLVLLTPETGRMHQLRAHASFAGAPLFGDPLYGGPRSAVLPDGRVIAVERIALHAVAVELPHLAARAPIPDDMIGLWRDLGGPVIDPLTGELLSSEPGG
jgi:23S rRNA pseudouridine1911/1915/1917 synthase